MMLLESYEELLLLYEKDVEIYECDLNKNTGNYGMYVDGVILIDTYISASDKKVVLVEEYHHHLTLVGNILDETDRANLKQENIARKLTIEKLLPSINLKRCFHEGITQPWQIAEELDLPEDFVVDGYNYYKKQLTI